MAFGGESVVSQRGKYFWRINDLKKNISCIEFSEDEEYYTFIKKCYQNGFRQIIVTSEIMVQLIQYFVIDQGLVVYNIELMEGDEELEDEVQNLLDLVDKSAVHINKLIHKINFLSEKSSIDIQRIYFKGRDNDNKAISFYLQSNGIISVDTTHYSIITDEVSNLIARCLFQS